MRAPTDTELQELADHMGTDLESLSNARICIWEDYVADGPGFCGKVAVILWSGGPEIIESYIWEPEMVLRRTGNFKIKQVARHGD